MVVVLNTEQKVLGFSAFCGQKQKAVRDRTPRVLKFLLPLMRHYVFNFSTNYFLKMKPYVIFL